MPPPVVALLLEAAARHLAKAEALEARAEHVRTARLAGALYARAAAERARAERATAWADIAGSKGPTGATPHRRRSHRR